MNNANEVNGQSETMTTGPNMKKIEKEMSVPSFQFEHHLVIEYFSPPHKCSEWNITFAPSSILLIGPVLCPIHNFLMDLITDCLYVYDFYSPPLPPVIPIEDQYSIWVISLPDCEITSPKNIDRVDSEVVSMQVWFFEKKGFDWLFILLFFYFLFFILHCCNH
jgi:hypothetical protein